MTTRNVIIDQDKDRTCISIDRGSGLRTYNPKYIDMRRLEHILNGKACYPMLSYSFDRCVFVFDLTKKG